MNLDEYKNALSRHDWYHAYSDDYSVWKRGNDQQKAMREARLRLDPLGTLWNEHAPDQFKIAAKGA